MRVSTSSVVIAALASSTSLSHLVSAAPTAPAPSDSTMATTASDAAPPVVPGAPDLSSILGNLPPSRRALQSPGSLEARQLGPLLDALADLAPPVVDKVLSLLGLSRQSASATTESIDDQLSPDQISHITQLVKNMTGGLPLPAPLHTGDGTGTHSGGNTTNSSAEHSDVSRRSKPDWMDRGASAPADLPLDLGRRSSPDSALPLSPVGAAGLPVDAEGLPVSPPVAPPAGPSPPMGPTQGNDTSSRPSPPAEAPFPPAGAPSPPVGVSPFSPNLPPNPPNTPAQAASMNAFNPPVFPA